MLRQIPIKHVPNCTVMLVSGLICLPQVRELKLSKCFSKPIQCGTCPCYLLLFQEDTQLISQIPYCLFLTSIKNEIMLHEMWDWLHVTGFVQLDHHMHRCPNAKFCSSVSHCAGGSEVGEELVTQTNHKVPDVSCHLWPCDEDAPDQDHEDRVEAIANVP